MIRIKDFVIERAVDLKKKKKKILEEDFPRQCY